MERPMNIRRVRWFCFAAAAAAAAALGAKAPEETASAGRDAFVLAIRDAIGPATSGFFVRTLADAQERRARLVVLELDTPGGLDTSMREMIQAILASSVPVAIYVSPSGARAASAGTYLLYASHVAAMAPATNLGAATPVQIGGPQAPTPEGKKDEKGEAQPEPGTALERKAINDSIAYIRGLAELRGRNAEWAEAAVRSATSLTATAAREQNVIDIVARDLPDLLQQMNGRTVATGAGQVKLATADLVLTRVEADWRTRVLAVITNPNIAYLLMLVGVYGLLLEGYNPGSFVPGVVGAIALLLALYAFQVLSVNYAGLGLLVLGIALMVAEAFAPSFGVLGVGGVIAFVIGSVVLLDTEAPGFQIARPLIGGIALAAAAVILLMGAYFMRARRKPVVTGPEQLLSEPAIAIADFERSGPVRIRGEIWNAVARAPVRKDERLRVVRVEGLTLEVQSDERA
jgi:membrane-bound serine protease (ClpP class)